MTTLKEVMTSHMNAVRAVTGQNSSLSINDATNGLIALSNGLKLPNLISNSPSEWQTAEVNIKGSYSYAPLNNQITLSEGTYTYSLELDLAKYASTATARIDNGTGKVTGNGAHDWGINANSWIEPGQSGVVSITFQVVKSGTFKYGIAGNPLKIGSFKYRRPMLTTGTLAVPWHI